MFAAVGLVQALAAVPLIGLPNVAVRDAAPGGFRAARLGAVLYATDGWFDACFFFVWQIALFVSLGESLAAYGGAMALAGLVGALSGLLLGRHIDAGHGRRAAALAYGAATVVVLLRAASFDSPWLAVGTNSLGPLTFFVLLGGARNDGERAGGTRMIDHISVGVADLERSARFYEATLAPLGLSRLVTRPATIGFGKTYPEFWINLRAGMEPVPPESGTHICLRAKATGDVDAFHAAALSAGGRSDGVPGLRPHDRVKYYAAFVIDPDGNRIEAVTFPTE